MEIVTQIAVQLVLIWLFGGKGGDGGACTA